MARQKRERNRQEDKQKAYDRRLNYFAQLVAAGHVKWDDRTQYQNDSEFILDTVFSDKLRAFYDLLFGPLAVRPRNPGWGSCLELPWQYFALAHPSDLSAKKKIAKVVLDARHRNSGRLLVPRGAHVLLGPGSTVFQVVMEMARRLRQSLEEGQDRCLGEPFQSHWHTDVFEIAWLLAPLAVRPSAPKILLAGSQVSHKQNERNSFIAPPPGVRKGGHALPSAKARDISTLIMGCSHVDLEGNIYTAVQDRKSDIEGYLAEASTTIIVVLTRDKIGTAGDGATKVNVSDGERRSFFLVTDERPNLREPLPRFAKIFYPDGELPSK